MVPAGTLYTVVIAGQAGSLWVPVSPGDVQTEIIGALQTLGFNPLAVTVKSTSMLPGITSFNWRGSVSARTTFPYNEDADALYQIKRAIETATGYAATVSNPDAGDPDASSDTTSGPFDGLVAGIDTDVKLIVGVIVGLVVLVVLIGGKDTLKAVAQR